MSFLFWDTEIAFFDGTMIIFDGTMVISGGDSHCVCVCVCVCMCVCLMSYLQNKMLVTLCPLQKMYFEILLVS